MHIKIDYHFKFYMQRGRQRNFKLYTSLALTIYNLWKEE
jgi:hypothetical protein